MTDKKNNWILFFIVLIAVISVTALNYINNRREHYIREFDLNKYEYHFYQTRLNSNQINELLEIDLNGLTDEELELINKKMNLYIITGVNLRDKIKNNNHSIVDIIELNHLNDKMNWMLIQLSNDYNRQLFFQLQKRNKD